MLLLLSLSLAGTSLMTPSTRELELLVFHVEGVEWDIGPHTPKAHAVF